MKENTLYARIVMVLLAVNVAFTGYVVYRLNGTTQEQIDSVSQTTPSVPEVQTTTESDGTTDPATEERTTDEIVPTDN
tara:strand:- start:160 stop:393 length:234 start_codon:yes stop_codon:yes gene_type:complete